MDVCRISVCGSVCGRVQYISMWINMWACAVYQYVDVCRILVCGRVQNISMWINMWTCAEYQYVDVCVEVCRISVCGRVGRGVQNSVPLAFGCSLLSSLHRDSAVLHCQISCSLFLYSTSFLFFFFFVPVFMYMIIMMLFVFDLQSCVHDPCIAALHILTALIVPGCVHVCLHFAVAVSLVYACFMY